ncbi:hypothetical protein Agub_g5359, partial [Astrephomene gubernaculifera]
NAADGLSSTNFAHAAAKLESVVSLTSARSALNLSRLYELTEPAAAPLTAVLSQPLPAAAEASESENQSRILQYLDDLRDAIAALASGLDPGSISSSNSGGRGSSTKRPSTTSSSSSSHPPASKGPSHSFPLLRRVCVARLARLWLGHLARCPPPLQPPQHQQTQHQLGGGADDDVSSRDSGSRSSSSSRSSGSSSHRSKSGSSLNSRRSSSSWGSKVREKMAGVLLQLFHLHRGGMAARGVLELMHVSKAAGTSMCRLAEASGCRALDFGSGRTCLLRQFGDQPRWLNGSHHWGELAGVAQSKSGGQPSAFLLYGLPRAATDLRTCTARMKLLRKHKLDFFANEYTVYNDLVLSNVTRHSLGGGPAPALQPLPPQQQQGQQQGKGVVRGGQNQGQQQPLP